MEMNLNEIVELCGESVDRSEYKFHTLTDEQTLFNILQNGVLSRRQLDDRNLRSIDPLIDFDATGSLDGLSVIRPTNKRNDAYDFLVNKQDALVLKPETNSCETTKVTYYRKGLKKLLLGKTKTVNKRIALFKGEGVTYNKILTSDILGVKLGTNTKIDEDMIHELTLQNQNMEVFNQSMTKKIDASYLDEKIKTLKTTR